MINIPLLLSENRAGMYLSRVPPPSIVTQKSIIPFEVTFFTPLTGEQSITLYSQYSRSSPYLNSDSKYYNLLPQWRFIDTGDNIIENITTSGNYVYYNNSIVGISGVEEFYYIDDMPTLVEQPVILWLTLDVSDMLYDTNIDKQNVDAYINSKVIIAQPYYVEGQSPDHLEINKDGINDIDILKWNTVEFPYVVSIKGGNIGCNNDSYPTIFDYPYSNILGLSGNLMQSISGLNNSQVIWNPTNPHFQRTNGNLYVGGFLKNSTTPYTTAESTYIAVTSDVYYYQPYVYNKIAWVANPEGNNVYNIIYYHTPPKTTISTITSFYHSTPLASCINVYDTPYITQADTSSWSYSGYGGIFGIATDECGNAWMTDVEMDLIYKFNTYGQLVSTISATSGTTPAGICLDEDKNILVTLFDSPSVLKYDVNGILISSIVINNELDYVDNDLLKPADILTDTDNNIWVTYCNSNSSALVKISNISGTIINQCNLNISATPIDIVLDSIDNSIWVTNACSHYNGFGQVQKFTTNCNLVSTYYFTQPGFITIDNNRTVWFTYDYHNVGFITNNGLTGSFVVSAEDVSMPTWFLSSNINDQILGGIACDIENRLWVINSIDNKMYVLSADTNHSFSQLLYSTFDINPDASQSWYINSDNNFETYNDPWLQSARAFGDWTGSEWLRNHNGSSNMINTLIYKTIEGQSNLFNIKTFSNNYDIRKFNESWDSASQMQSYALPLHNYQNVSLFFNYFDNMIGGLESTKQSIARQCFEKIANFNENHADIDNCNVKQLYTIAKQLNINIDDYNFDYPSELERLLDLYSINHQKLWGNRCKCNKNFHNLNRCSNCNHKHDLNLGTEFDSSTYILTANIPFVVRYRFSNDYYLINPDSSGLLTSFNTISWLTSANYHNYIFFNHIPTYCNEQVEGCINWGDPYTTLTETNSSLSAWYVDNGIVEETLNYILHKGLGLNKEG